MPIPLQKLDDRSYEDIIAELRALIPAYSNGEWTDHNPSDPGITLLELAAWLADSVIYRLNRITPASEMRFLELLFPELPAHLPDKPKKLTREERYRKLRELSAARPEDARAYLEDAKERFREDWRTKYRAVTPADFQEIVRQEIERQEIMDELPKRKALGRVMCLPGWNLRSQPPRQQVSHVSVILVGPDGEEPGDAVLGSVQKCLDERHLLGTRVHAVGPAFARVCVQAKVVATLRADPSDVEATIRDDLTRNYSPVPPKLPTLLQPAGDGWPLGRAVHLSEVYRVIEACEGVDYIEGAALVACPKQSVAGLVETDKVEIEPWQLVEIDPKDIVVNAFPRSAISGRS